MVEPIPANHPDTRPVPSRRKAFLPAIALLVSLGHTVSADYSPFRVGRVWEYRGKGVTVDPIHRDAGSYRPLVSFEERLRLTVLELRTRGDSTVITVEERDSLYARKSAPASSPFSDPSQPLPDTVVTRILTYVQKGTLRLRQGDSLSVGHRDSADLFFPTVAAAPGAPDIRPLANLAAGYQGVEYGSIYEWRPAQLHVGPVGWYVDGIGLYWLRIRTFIGTCDFRETRELLLTAFDGRPVDIGAVPPASPLAKDARIACGIVKRGFRGGVALSRREGGAALDVSGRSLPALTIKPFRP